MSLSRDEWLKLWGGFDEFSRVIAHIIIVNILNQQVDLVSQIIGGISVHAIAIISFFSS